MIHMMIVIIITLTTMQLGIMTLRITKLSILTYTA
jgi:hypothetical protein